MGAPPEEITRLLAAHGEGDKEALRRLVPLVYADLRRIASRQLFGRQPGQTLETTGLVHEAYLKLADAERAAWKDRGHFFAVASLAMRQIIVDHARRRRSQKRGGSQPIGSLEGVDIALDEEARSIIDLDEALAGLGALDERLPRLVECRLFAGLTAEETALALGVSKKTVDRDWKRALAWLRQTLEHRWNPMGPADAR
jgi:RNA polymerase sigma factor (TIGR02999 family)